MYSMYQNMHQHVPVPCHLNTPLPSSQGDVLSADWSLKACSWDRLGRTEMGLSALAVVWFCCSAIWKHSSPSAVRWSAALILDDSPVFAQPTHPSRPCVHHTTITAVPRRASKSTAKYLTNGLAVKIYAYKNPAKIRRACREKPTEQW